MIKHKDEVKEHRTCPRQLCCRMCTTHTEKTIAPSGLDKRVQMQGQPCAIQALMACGYFIMRHLMYSAVYYLHLILNSALQLASPNI